MAGKILGITERLKEKRRPLFLDAIREYGNIKHAAKAVGIPRKWHYEWLDDGNYAKEFEKALDESTESLELEAFRRAHDGVDEPVFHRGEIVGHIRKYSDQLLMFLLKARRPDTYRERQEIQQTVTHSGPVEIKVVRDDNWYNNADALPTEALAAPDSPAGITGEVQNPGERQAVGKNGNGFDGRM